jgi:glycosyltransferase involved in cell wall biosynthesis
MRIAMLSTIAWRTPPRHYGPYESVASLLTEGMVKRGLDVTLYATADSITNAKLHAVCPRGYEEDKTIDVKVWECLHISEVFEHAEEYDLIHNHFDFLPLTYSGLVSTPVLTTIQGFSSPRIYPVYEKYNGRTYYVSISNANRLPSLTYIATVYHGIALEQFTYQPTPGDYLLFFARIHPDKGTKEAIEIARRAGMKLIIAGLIHDREYFQRWVEPCIDDHTVTYVGSVDPVRRDSLMGGAYALLHPINFEEPFGLSVIESLACGTPVIAFRRGSMPEILEHGYNGILVSNVEEAVEAVQSIPLIDRSHCRKTVEQRFTADIMVENYIKVYRQILQKERTRAKTDAQTAQRFLSDGFPHPAALKRE